MRECRICRSTDRPFKAHSGNAKKGICLECHAAYCSEYKIIKKKHLNEINYKMKIISTLEAQNKVMREALEWIAKTDTCSVVHGSDVLYLSNWRNTRKQVAKEALKKCDEMNSGDENE